MDLDRATWTLAACLPEARALKLSPYNLNCLNLTLSCTRRRRRQRIQIPLVLRTRSHGVEGQNFPQTRPTYAVDHRCGQSFQISLWFSASSKPLPQTSKASPTAIFLRAHSGKEPKRDSNNYASDKSSPSTGPSACTR